MCNIEKNTFELQFLGTCAADFSKRLQTDCKDCFDKDARRSSALLINGSVLVDCGVHTPESLRILGIPWGKITDVIVTHLHGDHFQAAHIAAIARECSSPLRVWIHRDAPVAAMENVQLMPMAPLETYCMADGTKLTGLPANHAPEAYPQHLLLEKNEKKIFYGCDGAWLLHPTYRFLRGSKLDLAVFDCTVGDYEGDLRFAEHNSIPMLRLMLPSLRTVKIIHDQTRIYLSHLAPSLHKPHDETEEIAGAFGAHVAYDGLCVTV